MTRYFCTYCDRGYLSRALALYESLRQHCRSFTLWVLCFDAETLDALRTWKLPDIVPIALHAFEDGDAALLGAKTNRSLIEYYFTCTPSVLLYVLDKNPDIDVISYVDADLFFFGDPTPLYEELRERAVLVIGHRFPEYLRNYETLYGMYNVGLIAFRNDAAGHAILTWWRERCLEKCNDQSSKGQFADQKYLDDWPATFPGVVVLQHQGAGLAPWNAMRYELEAKRGKVLVSGDGLVFYHFHNVRMVRPGLFDACFDVYGFKQNTVLMRNIYAPYLRVLYRQTRRVGGFGNPRNHSDVTTGRELADFLVNGHSLLVSGPFVFRVHLEPLVRPFLKLRDVLLRWTSV